MPEPRTPRPPDRQHRTTGREICRSGAAASCFGWAWFPQRRGCDDVAVDAEADVRYAISGDARLAFQVFAGGPHEIAWVPSWISNQDLVGRDALHALLMERLASFATVGSYDQRGTGLSDPVSLAESPPAVPQRPRRPGSAVATHTTPPGLKSRGFPGARRRDLGESRVALQQAVAREGRLARCRASSLMTAPPLVRPIIIEPPLSALRRRKAT
jgi:hypothetical protein